MVVELPHTSELLTHEKRDTGKTRSALQVPARNNVTSDGGIVVSIAAFQAVDPGSIPGHRRHQF